MTSKKIGFVGLTHLGLVSAICAASKGFTILCFDQEIELINLLNNGSFPINEPGLIEVFNAHKERIIFTSDPKELSSCELVYISPDIPTNDHGISDLTCINDLLNLVNAYTDDKTIIVILSQVPPGFTRAHLKKGRTLFYQVETLIFGQAINRAIFPERIIIGSSDPKRALPGVYLNFLDKFNCPLLMMSLESAELAKISINMYLVSSVSTTNILAEICEKINANWDEIIPALRLDKRIGMDAYLKPGLGISGGNLERDLATILEIANKNNTFSETVYSWMRGSIYRKSWPIQIAKKLILEKTPNAIIALWGLAYKENTHSIKNSAAISTITSLKQTQFKGYDPAALLQKSDFTNLTVTSNPMEAIIGANALMILTPWPEFKNFSLRKIASTLKGNIIIDPYQLFDVDEGTNFGLNIVQLGKAAEGIN